MKREAGDLESVPHESAYSSHLGIRPVSLAHERTVFQMPITPALANRNGTLHGGALMSLIDHVAGTLAFVNCSPEMTNVTVEAKTNFLRGAQVGDMVTAVGQILHAGRRTVVVQVTTSRGDGRKMSFTTQTQLLVEIIR